MAQSADLTAYKAALAEKKKSRKKTNVYYFPIGRTITTVGGVLKMVDAGNLKAGIEYLMDGNLPGAADRLGKIFSDRSDVKGGAKVIAGGIILGRALDYTKTNPHIKMGKYGVKMV